MRKSPYARRNFFYEAFAIRGSVTPHVIPHVLIFGLIALVICLISWWLESAYEIDLRLEVAPFEIAGAAMGLLLILRTNAGYDRWWEARKLWGGIVNQSRNLAVAALAYGPEDNSWRERFIKWIAVFPHVARCSLRGQLPLQEVETLVGVEETKRIADSAHMPSYVSLQLANLLREATTRFDMDRFAFLQIDRERAELINHIGACERILKTPLPTAYAIKIRRFIAMFMFSLPFALLHRLTTEWMVPLITMLVAYPLISLDIIGIELQNPFTKKNLSHLPLDEICSAIQINVKGLLKQRVESDMAQDGQDELLADAK